MATETVQEYDIKFKFDSSFDKLKNLKTSMENFNKNQEASLRRQITLQKQLTKAMPKGLPGTTTAPGAPTTRVPKGPSLNQKEKELAKIEARRVTSLTRAKEAVQRTAFWLDASKNDAEKAAKAAAKERIEKARTASEVKLIVAQTKAALRADKVRTKELKKQSFFMRKMSSSSKQIAGNMIGAFAVAGALVGITQIGQDFESIEATILSVSETSELAGKNFEFVKNEAFRLGASLRSTAKDYAKLLASAKNQITGKESEELLTGILEASTVLGLSADDTSGAVRALQQMLGKTKITAEELRLQLAERLPGAVRLMAKAAQEAGIIGREVPEGQLVSAMEQLMKDGKLLAKDVLPFFSKELRKFASKGIEKALNSNRVAMNRFTFSLQEAANQFFKGGFGQGLTDSFNILGQGIRDLTPLWQFLGSIAGTVLDVINVSLKQILPIFVSIGNTIGNITIGIDKLTERFEIFGFIVDKVKTALKIIMKIVSAPLVLTAGLIEEASVALTGGTAKGFFVNRQAQEKLSREEITQRQEKDPRFVRERAIRGVEDKVVNVLKTIVNPFEALNKALGINQEIIVQVPLDGQVIAETVINTQDFQDATDTRIHHNR